MPTICQMQAKSSVDGKLYSWLSPTADYLGGGYPGPGVAQDVTVYSRAVAAAAAAVAPAITCAIVSPVAGATLTEGQALSFNGSISRAGAVVVRLGARALPVVVAGLSWSCSDSVRAADHGDQSVTAVATATDDGSTGSATPALVHVVAPAAVLQTTTDAMFWGTGKWLAQGSGANAYKLHDPGASLLFVATSEETMPIDVVGFAIAGGGASSLGLEINDVLTGQTLVGGTPDVKTSLVITLPAGAKKVRIVEFGCSIVSFTFGATPTPFSAPDHSLTMAGDSKLVGYYPTNICHGGYAARVRRLHPHYGQVVNFSLAGDLLADHDVTFGGEGIATLAARIVARNTGTVSRDYYLEWAVNDLYFPSSGLSVATAFQPELAALCDAIHSLDAAGRIFIESLVITTREATVSASGDLPSAYRNAVTTVASTRSYVTVVNGVAMVSSSNFSDGIHENEAGHAEAATYLGSILP